MKDNTIQENQHNAISTVNFAMIVILVIILLFGITLTIYGITFNSNQSLNKTTTTKSFETKSYAIAPSTTSIQGNYKMNDLSTNNLSSISMVTQNLTVNNTVKYPYTFENIDLRNSTGNEFVINLVNTKQNVSYNILLNRSSQDVRKFVYINFPETNNRFSWNIAINVFQWANLVNGNEIIFQYPRNYFLKCAYTVDYETPCSETLCKEVLFKTNINENYWMNLNIRGEINSRITLEVVGTNIFKQLGAQTLQTSKISNINYSNTAITFENSNTDNDNVLFQCNGIKVLDIYKNYVNSFVPQRFFTANSNAVKVVSGTLAVNIGNLIYDSPYLAWDVSTGPGTFILPDYSSDTLLWRGITLYVFKFGSTIFGLTIRVGNTTAYLNGIQNGSVSINGGANYIVYKLMLLGNTINSTQGWIALA